MIDWVQQGSVAATSFVASSVEAVEALTIVLAAGIVRGWRSALIGVMAALLLLAAIVAAFGTAIAAVPILLIATGFARHGGWIGDSGAIGILVGGNIAALLENVLRSARRKGRVPTL